MLPDRVSNPGPLTYESGALPIALRGLAGRFVHLTCRTLVISYPAGVGYPNLSGWERSHMGSTYLIHINGNAPRNHTFHCHAEPSPYLNGSELPVILYAING